MLSAWGKYVGGTPEASACVFIEAKNDTTTGKSISPMTRTQIAATR